MPANGRWDLIRRLKVKENDKNQDQWGMHGRVVYLVHFTIAGYCCCCQRSLGISWERCGYSGGLLNAVTSTSPGLSQKVRLFGWRKEMKRRMVLVLWLQKRNETHGIAIDQRCQPFSLGGTPKIIFIIPRNKCLWTRWEAKNGWTWGRKIKLLLNCHENLFLKKARRFVCGRQNVCFSALNVDKCLPSSIFFFNVLLTCIPVWSCK